jgi:hypothetical protein
MKRTSMKWLHNLRLIAAAAVAVLALGGGIASSALAVEPTTGQPGATAGNHCLEGTPVLGTPGRAEAAKGSVFNPSGTAGTVYAGNPGTASLGAASTAAVSQYDVACLQVTTH